MNFVPSNKLETAKFLSTVMLVSTGFVLGYFFSQIGIGVLTIGLAVAFICAIIIWLFTHSIFT